MQKEKRNFFINIRKLWPYMKESKMDLFGYIIVIIIEAILWAILPFISAKIILNITNGFIEQLVLSALAFFIIESILAIGYYFKGFFYQKIYQKTLVTLQTGLAREILKLEVKEIDTVSSGLFIDRLNNDTQEVSDLFMEYSYWISDIISNAGVFIAIFILNKYLFIYAIITTVSIFFINKVRVKKQYEIQRNVKKIKERKTGFTGELIRGIRDIKVLNATGNALNQTSKKIIEASNEELKMLSIRYKYLYFENHMRAFTDFLFIILGCILYKNGLLAIPTFVVIYNYQGRIQNLLMGITQITEFNRKFVLASDRIFEILENRKFAKEKFGTLNVKKLSGHIEFNNVKFGYEKENIIDNMSFEIKPNQKVAFVGKSGAGKTTLFNLITKLYTIKEGEILLDGYNINDLDCSSLRDNMSIITQNPYIFNFSIRENLLLAKENATMREIRSACKLACIDDFIMSLPNKYETILGENGVILSGGQKQRLAIARALLLKTEIILFDEATSALDNETQSEIQKAIVNLKGEYTILIVAHRLSTIIDSDNIFVVDKGKIIDSGSHKELLKKCEFYKNLYEKDLSV